jgi:hypothetical protein
LVTESEINIGGFVGQEFWLNKDWYTVNLLELFVTWSFLQLNEVIAIDSFNDHISKTEIDVSSQVWEELWSH